jgi:hypothetical protein
MENFDVTGAIIEFESGLLDGEGVVELFQYLVDSGMIYSLQGSYHRIAEKLFEAGLITAP